MNSYSKITFLFLWLCAATSAIAQMNQLTIEVTNKETEKPIEFANIYLNPCNCGGVTDRLGKFTTNLKPGDYKIVTSYIGFESDTIKLSISTNEQLTIDLNPSGYDLENIIVSGQDLRANIQRTQMGVQQLSAKQLQKLPTAIGEVDVLRSLTMLSGVGTAGEASNGLSIRGGSLDQNLVLLDHAPIFNPTHLFGLFSIFTPEAVSSVDLFRANVPARFGGRISSVVDIKTKNPNNEKPVINGGIGFVSSRLAIETPVVKEKIHALAAVRVAHNDFLFPLIERLKDTKANFLDGTLKLIFRPTKKDNLYFSGFYSHDFYQLDIGSSINNIVATSNQYDYTTLNGTLNWLHTFSDETAIRTTLVSSDYLPQILFPQEATTDKLTYESRIKYWSFINELTTKLAPTIPLSLGVQANRYQLSPGALLAGNIQEISSTILPNETSYELAAFADAEWEIQEKLAISAGLRFSYFLLNGPFAQANYISPNRTEIASITNFDKGESVKTYNGLEPRLGLRWQFRPSTSLKASYAQTKQYLQNIYNSTTPLPTSRWKTSDPYILPQSGSTYSLGIYQNLADNQVELSVEGYYRTIENVLDYKPGADFFLQAFIERDVLQGEGKAYGIELSMNKPNGPINGWFNYTWSRSQRKFESQDLRSRINNNQWFSSDFDRPHVFNGTINLQPNEYNTFSFNFTYQTGRPYTVANGVFRVDELLVPIFLERNNARLPAYHRMDFSWRIHNGSTKKNKRWVGDWVFTIYNLYGRKNAYNWYYGQKFGNRFGQVFGDSPLGAFQLSIFSAPAVSLGYSFRFE